MFTGLVIGGILLIVALVVFSHWCFYRAGREDGYEQGLAERKPQAPRHARTAPRRAPDRTTLVSDDPPAPSDWYEPPPGPIRSHTAADSLKSLVILPEPGTYLPQPVRTTAPGTGTFAKVDVGATGPIAKLVADNEAWNAQQAVEDEIFRLGLALD